MSNNDVSQLFQWYKQQQGALLPDYKDRFLVITSEGVYGDYETLEQAYFAASAQLPAGSYLVQRCSEGDEDIVARFSSRVSFV